jgi:hypothetical protein
MFRSYSSKHAIFENYSLFFRYAISAATDEAVDKVVYLDLAMRTFVKK